MRRPAAGRARGGARRSVENCVYKYSAEWKLAVAGREECGGAADRETVAVAEGGGIWRRRRRQIGPSRGRRGTESGVDE